MGMSWTKEQSQVIEIRNRNLLVSAAAGSGKTAVLVERIVQKVSDPRRPVDIDRMLIVTFTKAAAAEMRERVSQAVEKRMEKEPENNSLQRQYTLVHNAQITTIDSFCLYVVRNYFQTIDLEPSFRIADPGELQLLKADVAKEVMEQHYREKSEGFLKLADRYATAKSDDALVEFMLRLYDFSQSYPWPQEWLASLQGAYQIESLEDFNQQEWMQGFMQYLAHITDDLKKQMEDAKILCQDDDGPQMYLAAVQDDLILLEALCACESYEEYGRHLLTAKYTKLGVNRKYEGSVQKQEQVKDLRKRMKDTLGKIQSAYFYQDSECMVADFGKILPDVEALSSLTQVFTQAYQNAKKERNLLDFSDIEHFALNILVDEKTKEAKAPAKELREIYEEIMIDEYQDSNYVQETILRAVSREADGANNIFMVGDVKQSIYRFRLARPELFIDKYKSYTTQESSCQKIDLHKNFRSRMEVIDSINHIFYKIMHEDLGNVEYDAQAALYAAATYPKAPETKESSAVFRSELLLAQATDEELADAGATDWQELEAQMIAARIQELLENQFVTDADTGTLRKARYRDIVILLRSVSGWADKFLKVLTEAGIPAHTTSQTGYFAAVEVQTVLSMLSILDNPLQDIPLAAVLLSPIGGMDGEELAIIRAASKEHFYYLALEEYARYGPSAEAGEADKNASEVIVQEKVVRFLNRYQKLRALTAYTPIYKLILAVLNETGYASYIQAMPAGTKRRANIDMLLEKAIAYEKTSYKGLFHFVRYIEKLKKYEIDFGEADITSENEDVVRIMSIHKSKGLEFPIVFVGGMGKQFNRQDIRSRLILHPEYGVGLDYVDADKRIRKSGFLKKVMENELAIENQGEELRVLYVALTRAKEKLIMTASIKEEPMPEKEFLNDKDGTRPMDYFSRYHASSYLDWVYPCIVNNQELYQIRIYRPDDIQIQKNVEDAIEHLNQVQVQKLSHMADKKTYEELDEKLSWSYPFASDMDLKTKISVTELKRRQHMVLEEDMPPQEEWFVQETERTVPAFMRTEEVLENKGAMRGSAVHKIMEEVDFVQNIQSKDQTLDLCGQIETMYEKQHITKEMKELVNPQIIARFLHNPLATRMAKAQQQKMLYKEQPFVMGIPASRIYEGASEELVLIQGIVDAYWIEDGEIVILDYKTDSVKAAETLLNRYQIQLALYGEALEKAAGKKIKEKLIYSFALQEVIRVL